jgi:hypothetical protein
MVVDFFTILRFFFITILRLFYGYFILFALAAVIMNAATKWVEGAGDCSLLIFYDPNSIYMQFYLYKQGERSQLCYLFSYQRCEINANCANENKAKIFTDRLV